MTPESLNLLWKPILKPNFQTIKQVEPNKFN